MTDAAGCISLGMDDLKSSLSNSSTFKTWVGASTAAQALKAIHQSAVRPPDDGREYTTAALRNLEPFVLVWDEGGSKDKGKAGGGHEFLPSGRFGLRFYWRLPTEIRKHPAEVDLRFNNAVGGVIDDLCSAGLGATADRLDVDRVEWGPIRRYRRSKVIGQDDVVYKDVTVEWSG